MGTIRPLINCLTWIVFCHIAGDYIFKPKLDRVHVDCPNLYWFVANGVCYCLPYLICFGIRWQLLALFVASVLVYYFGDWKEKLKFFWRNYFKLAVALTYIIPIFIEKNAAAIVKFT